MRGSVQQVYVVGAHGHQRIALLDRRGHVVQSRRAGSLGGVVYRGVKPGAGYRVRPAGGHASGPVTVMPDRSAPPSTRFYSQRIPTSGYGYLTVRDGIKLAIDVHLPSGPGPYPTLVEYSGYGYANPAGPNNGISQIATLLGFAVVDVNMRGTGCSGGAFNYFDTLQNLDGYDVIETVAHQPWALHHKVGMMGISYGGISQLFVAKTDPPDLAAITPLSVIDNSATTLYPGGILNTGFALGWAKDRDQDALANSPTQRSGLGAAAHPRRRRDLQGQPGAAPGGRQPGLEGPRQQPLRAVGRRPAVADHVRAQDQGADVHGLPVHRRADRRPLPRPRRALHRHPPQVVHVHQRRARRLVGPVDVHALV